MFFFSFQYIQTISARRLTILKLIYEQYWNSQTKPCVNRRRSAHHQRFAYHPLKSVALLTTHNIYSRQTDIRAPPSPRDSNPQSQLASVRKPTPQNALPPGLVKESFSIAIRRGKGKGKGHPCTVTEALYRPYGP